MRGLGLWCPRHEVKNSTCNFWLPRNLTAVISQYPQGLFQEPWWIPKYGCSNPLCKMAQDNASSQPSPSVDSQPQMENTGGWICRCERGDTDGRLHIYWKTSMHKRTHAGQTPVGQRPTMFRTIKQLLHFISVLKNMPCVDELFSSLIHWLSPYWEPVLFQALC